MNARFPLALILSLGLMVAGCPENPSTDDDDDSATPVPASAPQLTSIDPNYYLAVGGVTVTLTGLHFEDPSAGTTTVSFGANAATDVTVVDDTTITATVPAGATGWVDVTVTNDVDSATLTNGFAYLEPGLLAADGRSGTSGNLYWVDLATAATETIGAIGYGLTGMSWGPDGNLYGAESSQYGNVPTTHNGRLIRVDPSTGAGTAIGELVDSVDPTNFHSSIPDLALLGNRLLCWTEDSDVPCEIDIATGTVTMFGPNEISSWGSGLTVLPDGTLVTFADGAMNDATDGDGYDSYIYTVDAGTGSTTQGPAVGGGVEAEMFNSAAQIDGTVYVVGADYSYDEVNNFATRLYTVDVQSGAVTLVGELPLAIDAIVESYRLPALPQ